jgi:hypothetical protein
MAKSKATLMETLVAPHGNYDAFTDSQGFTIVDLNTSGDNYCHRAEANAAFVYKDHLISMSTSGLNHGACRTKIAIFDKNRDLVTETDTVEEAIEYLNQM